MQAHALQHTPATDANKRESSAFICDVIFDVIYRNRKNKMANSSNNCSLQFRTEIIQCVQITCACVLSIIFYRNFWNFIIFHRRRWHFHSFSMNGFSFVQSFVRSFYSDAFIWRVRWANVGPDVPQQRCNKCFGWCSKFLHRRLSLLVSIGRVTVHVSVCVWLLQR